MKFKSTLVVTLAIIFSFFSCSSDDEPTNEVHIRLTNNSEFKFEDTTYNNINFGDIEPGEKTEYKLFKNQYSYGSVSILIENEQYGWQPIDFVGESLLEDGNYTFEYSFDNENKVLTDKLIRD